MILSAASAGRGTARTAPGSPGRGFSLIEIMLVLVLIAALAALAVPTFDTMLGRATLRETAAQVAASVDEAGSDAARRGIALDLYATERASGGWALMASVVPRHEPEDQSSLSTAPPSEPAAQPADPPADKVLAKLPSGFRFAGNAPTESALPEPTAGAEPASERLSFCILWPTGEATPIADLQLLSPEGESAKLTVSALMGKCKVTFIGATTPRAADPAKPTATRPAPKPAPARSLGAPEPEPEPAPEEEY